MSTAYIPLQGQFPQIQTPTQAAQGIMSLRQGATQNQLMQQQVQQLAMQNQIAQMNMQNMQLWGRAMQGGSQGPSDDSNPNANAQQQPAQPAQGNTQPGQTSGQMSEVPGTVAMAPGGAPANMGALPAQGQPMGMAQALDPEAQAMSGGISGAPAATPSPSPAAQGQPAMTGNQRQPQQQQQQIDPKIYGSTVATYANRFLASGGNPMWLQQNILSPALKQQTEVMALTKDKRQEAIAQGQQRAGDFQAIMNIPANPGPDYTGLTRKQAWDQLGEQRYNEGALNDQQYQKWVNSPAPDDATLGWYRDRNLIATDQAVIAEHRGIAYYRTQQGEEAKSKAWAQNLQANAGVALSGMPTDPAQIAGYMARQTPDVQAFWKNGGSPSDPDDVRQMLVQATQLTQGQKNAQQAEAGLLTQGRNAALAGSAEQWGAWKNEVKHSNPTLYNQIKDLPLTDSAPEQLNSMMLTGEQFAMQGSRNQTQQARADAADARNTQRAFMNQMMEMKENLREQAFANKNNGLTPNQVNQKWEKLRTDDQADYKQISDLQAQISAGKFLGAQNNGTPLSPQDKQAMQAKLAYAQSHLQESQMERARLMGVDTVDPGNVPAGGAIPSSNPAMEWRKAAASKNPANDDQTAYIMTKQKPAAAAPAPPPPTLNQARSSGHNPNSAPPAPATSAGRPQAQNPNPQGNSAPETGTPRMGKQRGQQPPGQNNQASQLPPQARSRLKEGVTTTFGNGQKWTLQNGKPVLLGQ